MKTLLSLCFLFLLQTCFAQIKTKRFSTQTLPKSIQFKGKVVSAIGWTDAGGQHILIATETGDMPGSGDEDARDAFIYAYHFLLNNNEWQQAWRVYDYVKGCQVDLDASFVNKAVTVTDLDKDSTAEVWLMYKTACRGDVSPASMKIIMYEGGSKYAARGRNKVKLGPGQFEGGEYSFDDAFTKAPEVFKKHAIQLWKSNVMEEWK